MKLPWSLPAVSVPPQERLQILLLSAVAVLIIAYVARVRPMQSEIEEIIAGLESTSASSEPSVPFDDAAYGTAPDAALAVFYSAMESALSSAGLAVESRQARLEPDPRFPATALVYESRARGKWSSVTRFLADVRSARPRIQIPRMVIHRLERPQHVEIFFEARALAIAAPAQ